MHNYHLTFLNSFNIKNSSEGLLEPSGLVLSNKGNTLWTVSDDTNKIFKISLTGQLKKKKSFTIPDTELEGITLIDNGQTLVVVKESQNELIMISLKTQKVINRKKLDQISGYKKIAHYFPAETKNKGLEGITWNPVNGNIFVLKEGEPGLLIEISSDLKHIIKYQLLNEKNGFCDDKISAEAIDYSDIVYDDSIDQFWIISDRAKRLFLYDWASNRVIQSMKLSYTEKGQYKEINKAEGIALATNNNRLYIVSDESARLYVFDIR